MKPSGLDIDSCKVRFGNFDPCFVFLFAEPGFDIEAGLGGCASNEIYNDFVADQRPTAPILRDEGK